MHYSPAVEVFVGGMITLVVALLVQVVVIPRVQARTRNRERWENDVIELRTLINDELPEATQELEFAADAVGLYEASRGSSKYDEQRLKALIDEERVRLDAARKRCFGLAYRLARVEGRVSLVNRRDTYWARLTLARTDFYTELMDTRLDPENEQKTEDELNERKARLEAGLSRLAEVGGVITDSVAPPPRRRVRKFYRRTARKLRDLGGNPKRAN